MLLQTQSHALRPLTTAHLAQTMTLLELTGEELRQKIEATLASNPALELMEETHCPHCHRLLTGRSACPSCSAPNKLNRDEPIVFVSPRRDFTTPRGQFSADDLPSEEWTAALEDLPTYVMRQIATELDPEDRGIAAHLLTSLNEDGLLSIPLLEIARYHHVPLEPRPGSPAPDPTRRPAWGRLVHPARSAPGAARIAGGDPHGTAVGCPRH